MRLRPIPRKHLEYLIITSRPLHNKFLLVSSFRVRSGFLVYWVSLDAGIETTGICLAFDFDELLVLLKFVVWVHRRRNCVVEWAYVSCRWVFRHLSSVHRRGKLSLERIVTAYRPFHFYFNGVFSTTKNSWWQNRINLAVFLNINESRLLKVLSR